jgi:hypothetical protein
MIRICPLKRACCESWALNIVCTGLVSALGDDFFCCLLMLFKCPRYEFGSVLRSRGPEENIGIQRQLLASQILTGESI